MRGAVKAWGFYVAGVVTVLLALWLYGRRFYLEVARPAAEEPD